MSSFILHLYSIISVSILITSVLNSASDRLSISSSLSYFSGGFLKKYFIYLFLERGEGREKGEKQWCVRETLAASRMPTMQACALTDNWTGNILVHRPALNPLSHTSQGFFLEFWSVVLFGPQFFVLAQLLCCKGWSLRYSPGWGNQLCCFVTLYVGEGSEREQCHLLGSPCFQSFPLLLTSELGPSGADSQVGGLCMF